MTATTISRSRRWEEGMKSYTYSRVACNLYQFKKLNPKFQVVRFEVERDVFQKPRNLPFPAKLTVQGVGSI